MVNEREMPQYLKSDNAFIAHRLRYYSDTTSIKASQLRDKLFPAFYLGSPEGTSILECRRKAIETLRDSKAEVIVVTATKDRPDSIEKAFQVLESQKGSILWNWLVVDNGVDPQTKKFLDSVQDDRVIYVPYREQTGCAYPIRNFGLDILHFAKNRQPNGACFLIVVDSDDKLYSEYSLHELLRIQKSRVDRESGKALVHGFANSEIHENDGSITYVPNPRDWDSTFPNIHNLKEVYDKGLNILSGMFPIEFLDWLRYPQEFSFEDDGFNQKLLLQAKKRNLVWLADNIPITTKVFHQNSMSASNNQIGNQDEVGKIGLHLVTGVRARIVVYLKSITDYFIREGL